MLTLYQFNSCPFCSKVRAFLHHTNMPFTTVEVSPFGMKELDFTDHKKVPVLRDGDQVIVESAAIVEHLSQAHALPVTANDADWTHWVDQTLVHYLPPLVHPGFSVSWRNFAKVMTREQIGGVKGFFTRLGGAVVMPRVARKMMTKHAIREPRQEFSQQIDRWVQEGLAGKAFFGGDEPGLVDTSVFGVLHSVAGLNIVEPEQTRNPAFSRWYQACATTMSA